MGVNCFICINLPKLKIMLFFAGFVVGVFATLMYLAYRQFYNDND